MVSKQRGIKNILIQTVHDQKLATRALKFFKRSHREIKMIKISSAEMRPKDLTARICFMESWADLSCTMCTSYIRTQTQRI